MQKTTHQYTGAHTRQFGTRTVKKIRMSIYMTCWEAVNIPA